MQPLLTAEQQELMALARRLAVQFGGKTIKAIRPLGGGTDLGSADIEPELVTNLFDSAREKRRPVRYDDLPPNLLHAILSAEEHRLQHAGIDPMTARSWRAFHDVDEFAPDIPNAPGDLPRDRHGTGGRTTLPGCVR